MAIQRSRATRIVMELIDLRHDSRVPERSDRREANRRLEAGRANSLGSFIDECAHRCFGNGRAREAAGMPAARHPIRLVDELPGVNDVRVTPRDAEERLEGAIQEPRALGGIRERIRASLFHPGRVLDAHERI